MSSPRPLEITVFSSTEDIASTTIHGELLVHYPFEAKEITPPWDQDLIQEIYKTEFTTNGASVKFTLILLNDIKQVLLDDVLSLDMPLGDMVIFASRHSAKSGQPALLCHTPGNVSSDIMIGGQPNRIAKGSGLLQYYLFQNLSRYAQEREFSFPVTQEVTHHGPTEFDVPMAFVELGSAEPEWKNIEGGKIVADAIIETGRNMAENHFSNGVWAKGAIKVCVGFGGMHYMPNFIKRVPLGFGFAHTVPKYKAAGVTADTIKHLQERTLEPIDYWVVDWKGLNSPEKQHLMPLLEATEIPIKKSKQLGK